MSISNCASCGADSRSAPITGIVTRQEKTTQQEVAATVRPNGIPEQTVQPTNISQGVTLSNNALAAIFNFQS